ncbi:MAG: CpsB/CapC family capsule biosynthesis tyrosine phosphatase [Pseudomonadota bacterium]
MIDLHSHILPGIDDGSPDMETSLNMARMAVAAGTQVLACTPHVTPGIYDNTAATIFLAVTEFRKALQEAAIPLHVVAGCDAHVRPDMVEFIGSDLHYRLHGTRYFLFEPPHHVIPPKIDALAERLVEAGFVPVLTHPERLSWIGKRYDILEKLNGAGCLIQVTAGSFTGNFGSRARDLALRMLEEGRVDIIASDGHNLTSRPPTMDKARDLVADSVGADMAQDMVRERPLQILQNLAITPRYRQINPSRDRKAASGRRKTGASRREPSRWRSLFGPKGGAG